jgi:Domain of unknown function (DUF4956)
MDAKPETVADHTVADHTVDHPKPPKPRLWWLAAFQLCVVGLVVAIARLTRSHIAPALIDDQVRDLSGAQMPVTATGLAWGERYWLTAVVAMVGALLLMLPIAWTYVATRERHKVDKSLVTTISLLPLAVAAIMVIVRDSLAVAFSLAGIAGLVRFRNALDDARDAMYVILAIAVGLGAGVGSLEAAAALSVLFNLVAVILWKWNTAQPVIVDIALGERSVPEGQSLFQTLTSSQPPGRHPAPVAEWLEPADAKPLLENGPTPTLENGAASRRNGMLRVHAADDITTRREIEEVIDQHAKRWVFESDDRGADGLPTLTYEIRLKKRYQPAHLLGALQHRLGPRMAETAPMNGAPPESETPPAEAHT